MRIGFTLPNNWGVDDPGEVVALAESAEALGFHSVWVNHHLFNVGYVGDRLGGRPYHDALTVLTWVAARTSTVRLGTSVLVLPYLHPVVLAKSIATLDSLSKGRVVLGVGAGALPEENAALGSDYTTRGRYTDESIQVLKELFTAEDPRFAGEHFAFEGVKFSPKPQQRPHPPIVIGGNRPAALRRVARLGDGWHPLGLPPASYAGRLERIDVELAAAGRTRAELELSVRLDIDLRADGDPAADGAPPLHGTADQIVARAAEYEAVGVSELVVSMNTGDVAALRSMLERVADRVLPRI